MGKCKHFSPCDCHHPSYPSNFYSSLGWSPVIDAVEVDGGYVLKVIEWIGGSQNKPAVNVYVSIHGYTNNIEDATVIQFSGGGSGGGSVLIVNNTTVPLTIGNLNTLYLNTVVGTDVYCPAIDTLYKKVDLTTWISYLVVQPNP